METREFKCFSKILTVCNNRGFGDLAHEIINNVGQTYLDKKEIKSLLSKTPKTVKFADKVTFLENTSYENNCAKCENTVDKGSAGFLQGKLLYHVLCGLEVVGDKASSNNYYKRWAAQTATKNVMVEDEEEV